MLGGSNLVEKKELVVRIAQELMWPRMCFNFDRLLHRKKKDDRGTIKGNVSGRDLHFRSVICSRTQTMSPAGFSLRAHKRDRSEEIKERKREMANKVANISDIIHRVASSCLSHHLPGCNTMHHHDDESMDGCDYRAALERDEAATVTTATEDQEEEDEEDSSTETLTNIWEDEKGVLILERVKEMEGLMTEVFEAVSAAKKAYVSLQEAHCPWDPDRMRVADAAVVGELRRLGRLRDQFRRVGGGARPAWVGAPLLREVVAPYEAALEDLRRELKAKEVEVEGLKEKLMMRSGGGGGGTPRGSGIGIRKGRIHCGSNRRVECITGLGMLTAAATPELFETCMEEVKSASKSFTAHLLSLMRAARWDIAAATRSIIDNCSPDDTATGADHLTIPNVDPRHAKHALESYVTLKIFHGFENETFYIEGSLTSLLHPSEFRHDCFTQFRDMRSMDPAEILSILPTCQFGKFAGKKYLSMVHPKMEESLFGGTEQRRQVLAGVHPRTGFYGEYLRLAKAVWLLHLVAFALDPSPSHFEASKGAVFHPDYMESVVRFASGQVPGGSVVGFSVGPGFKLSNGSVVRARVYVVPS